MKPELEKRVFLVELDALLDTRLSLLHRHCPDKVIYLLKNGYLRRNVDHFPGLPFREFRRLYRERDKTLLKEAIATPVMDMLKEYVREVTFNSMNGPHPYDPVVMVNIWPYKLSKNETKNVVDMIASKLGGQCTVEAIDMSYEKITNRFLKDNHVSYFALYDYVEYLNVRMQDPNIKKTGTPDIGLVIPQIIFADPSNQYKPDFIKDFEVACDLYGPFFALNFMPVSDFSIHMTHETATKLKEPG